MASAQIDDQFDLFGGFLAEIEGYLPVIAANVRRLLTSPGDEDLLEESHRFAHTIKSSAAMMGIPELRRVAAPMEALLARAYAGDIAIDDAVVATIDGTLLRIRSCLTLQQAGSDMEALVKENDQAYAGLRTKAPSRQQAPSEDARDRLLHAGSTAPEPLPAAKETAPIAPVAALTIDDQPADAALPVAPEVLETAIPDDRQPLTAAVEFAPVVAGSDSSALQPDRPRLTVLPGRLATGSRAPSPPASRSIAAEWLAEILGGAPEAASTPVESTDEALEETAAEPALPAVDLAALQSEWEQRLVAERTALVAQLERERQDAALLVESERRLHAEQRRALLDEHKQALREAEAERERALLEQRETLEQEVQRYIEEDLRPQLEEEIRQEVTHEFQVAALLDPTPQALATRRPQPTPVYAYVDDPELAAEMRDIFAQEAAEHIQAIGEQTLALRAQPEAPEHLQALRRSVHTLKGASSTVGMTDVATLCHQIESALDRQLEEGTLPGVPGQTLLLLESCDALEALVRGDVAAADQARVLAERLSVVTGIEVPAVQSEPVERSTVAPLSASAAMSEAGDLPALEGQSPAALVEFEPGESAAYPVERAGSASGLALRVPLTELDRLLAANHELIITESALELRLQRLKRTLDDVRHTGNRLRAAGSRLESGTSFAAMLVGGAQAALPAPLVPKSESVVTPSWRDALRGSVGTITSDEFDSLEMDRYTEFHRLTREVSEAALDVAASDAEIADVLDDLRLTLKQQQRLHTVQNQVLLHARLVPLQLILPRLARAVQAVAAQQGKQVEFVVEGQETLFDRAVMEEVADALLHLVRNAVDHGIESPAARLAAGKPAQGAIRLSARRVGPEIIIVLADDGPGLDTAAIRRAAIARGLVSDAAHPTENELQQLVFSPGLSTAATITDISGRGVGLDVVRANIQALRGEVELSSGSGTGTTFTLRVPISLSLLTVALLEAAAYTYAIPLTLVRHVEKVAARRVQTEDGRQVVRHGGRTYTVVELAALLGLPATAHGNAPLSLVFVGSAQGTVALVVDKLAGKREVVVKDLGRQLRSVRGVHGATALGNGELALILDIPALLQQEPVVRREVLSAPREIHRQRQLLVVDDSPSVRRLTCAVFERQGWQVRPARDGVEALDLLQGWRPDAVVMDIEMPRMDGFELLAILRRQPETASLPAVMVTSRAGEKHREKAVRLGVDAYLVKPFREEELLGTVDGLLGQSSVTVPASTR